MKKFVIVIAGLFANLLYAAEELWVIYHAGCPRCDAFLTEVVATYPNHDFLDKSVFLPLKLLNTSIPLHQEQILKITPPVYSTPTFIRVEKSVDGEPRVIDRWAGYMDRGAFYKKLNEGSKKNEHVQ